MIRSSTCNFANIFTYFQNFTSDFVCVSNEDFLNGERQQLINEVICQHFFREGLLNVAETLVEVNERVCLFFFKFILKKNAHGKFLYNTLIFLNDYLLFMMFWKSCDAQFQTTYALTSSPQDIYLYEIFFLMVKTGKWYKDITKNIKNIIKLWLVN